jgi:hypothetical protein
VWKNTYAISIHKVFQWAHPFPWNSSHFVIDTFITPFKILSRTSRNNWGDRR